MTFEKEEMNTDDVVDAATKIVEAAVVITQLDEQGEYRQSWILGEDEPPKPILPPAYCWRVVDTFTPLASEVIKVTRVYIPEIDLNFKFNNNQRKNNNDK